MILVWNIFMLNGLFFYFKMNLYEWCYIYRFNIELFEIGLYFNMFYILRLNNWVCLIFCGMYIYFDVG